jgi:anti-sigma regulatory factor (Ser/Thr protein kinase)
MAEREHQVAAYDGAAALVRRVASFVAASLEDGVPVVTISRPTHRRAVEDLLVDIGADPVRASRDGTLVALDADETMGLFMVDGRPDPTRFAGVVASVVASLVPTGNRPVNAFGEMVALLWERGEVAAALELESLWNTAIVAHPIRLLCAYPGELLAGSGLNDVARACDLHDHVSLIGTHPSAGEIPTCSDAALSSVHLPVPAAVASVRRFVRDALTAWDLHGLVGDVALVTSELATNAITHGSSPFRTSLVRADGVVRVAVEDGSSAWPEGHHARLGDQDGRGMAIVATLSQRSGCDSTPSGKVAWAELSI